MIQGREVLRQRRQSAWMDIVWYLFSDFCFMIITICSMIHNGEFELNSFTGPLIFLTVISVICIWDGIRMIRTPEKLLNRENKNHGGSVFEMADKLYGDIIYENKYIMASHEVIASKTNEIQPCVQMGCVSYNICIYEYAKRQIGILLYVYWKS